MTQGEINMSDSTTENHRSTRTSFLDRTWSEHWTVMALRPIRPPDVAALRADMVEFMASNPDHPLSCNLAADGRRWLPVAPSERESHIANLIVSGTAVDGVDDPHALLMEHRPADDAAAPYKVIVGEESIILYFAHVAGDAVVFSPFSVLMALGDVEGLRPLRADAGLPTVARVFAKEFGAHWREWWRHLRSATAPAATGATGVVAPRPLVAETTAVGMPLSVEGLNSFKAWRKETCPEISAAALMASATYLAFAAEGLPINRDAFYTLVDLRRHLPKNQALRPGNLAKSLLVHTDLADPIRVGDDLRGLVDSARGVPALLSGAVSEALRRSRGHGHGTAPASAVVTMTFNSMMRNPGIEHIPWTDPAEARYLGMSYPIGGDGISVFACAVEGKIDFAASFNPNVLDRDAVHRALVRLQDMPSLLSNPAGESAARLRDRFAPIQIQTG